MHQEALSELIDVLLTAAKKIISSGKTLTVEAILLVQKQDNYHLVYLGDLRPHWDRVRDWVEEEYTRLLKQQTQLGNPFTLVAVLVVSDNYCKDLKDMELTIEGHRKTPFVPKADQPEELAVQIYFHHTQQMVSHRYTRNKDSIDFGPRKTVRTVDTPRAHLANLWPKNA